MQTMLVWNSNRDLPVGAEDQFVLSCALAVGTLKTSLPHAVRSITVATFPCACTPHGSACLLLLPIRAKYVSRCAVWVQESHTPTAREAAPPAQRRGQSYRSSDTSSPEHHPYGVCLFYFGCIISQPHRPCTPPSACISLLAFAVRCPALLKKELPSSNFQPPLLPAECLSGLCLLCCRYGRGGTRQPHPSGGPRAMRTRSLCRAAPLRRLHGPRHAALVPPGGPKAGERPGRRTGAAKIGRYSRLVAGGPCDVCTRGMCRAPHCALRLSHAVLPLRSWGSSRGRAAVELGVTLRWSMGVTLQKHGLRRAAALCCAPGPCHAPVVPPSQAPMKVGGLLIP